MRAACIVVAAGRGERLGFGLPKALVPLAGVSLLGRAAAAVAATRRVEVLVAVVPPGSEAAVSERLAGELARSLPADLASGLDVRVLGGGATRRESVAAGLRATPADVGHVLVHDAARCSGRGAEVAGRVLDALAAGRSAVIPAVPVTDTVKQVDDGGRVVATPARSGLRAVQTPQGFVRAVLEDAHAAAHERGDEAATDDAGLVEALGGEVWVVAGHPELFKITTPLDLRVAEAPLVADPVAADPVAADPVAADPVAADPGGAS